MSLKKTKSSLKQQVLKNSTTGIKNPITKPKPIFPITVSVFNNKGGVGKTTILWNLAAALGSIGKNVLVIDFDPQCNLSIATLGPDEFLNKLKSTRAKPHGETIKAFVAPFITQNRTITPTTFLPLNSSTTGVEIIPGDFWLNNFADQLSVGTDVISGGGLIRFLLL